MYTNHARAMPCTFNRNIYLPQIRREKSRVYALMHVQNNAFIFGNLTQINEGRNLQY